MLPSKACFVVPSNLGSNEITASSVDESGTILEVSAPIVHEVFRRAMDAPMRISVPEAIISTAYATEQPMGTTETSLSADGSTMAYVSYGHVYVADVETGIARRVWESLGSIGTKGGTAGQIDLSGDGTLLVLVDITSVWLVEVATGNASLLNGFTDPPFGQDPWSGGHPRISDSGSTVVFESGVYESGQPFIQRIYALDSDTLSYEEVSIASNGNPANASSFSPDVSADGNRIVFTSSAPNLVDGPASAALDVFLHDRTTGDTLLVTSGTYGGGGNADSFHPSISADGAWVVFESDATDLVPNDIDGQSNMFLYEVASGQIQIVETGYDDLRGSVRMWPSISADGRFLAHVTLPEGGVIVDRQTQILSTPFMPDPLSSITYGVAPDFGSIGVSDDGMVVSAPVQISDRPITNAFVYRAADDTLKIESQAYVGDQSNGASGHPTISNGAKRVAFVSEGTNLTPTYTGFGWEVFVRDLGEGRTWEPAASSHSDSANTQRFSDGPRISSDGNTLVYSSRLLSAAGEAEDDKYRIRVVDLNTGISETLPTPDPLFSYGRPQVSGDGSRIVYWRGIAYPSDNPYPFLADGDGPLYLFDRRTEANVEIAPAVKAFGLSENGNYVVFHSTRGDLDPDNSVVDEAMYLYQSADGSLERIDIPFFEPLNDDGRMFVSNSGDLAVYATRLFHIDLGAFSELPQPRDGEHWGAINPASLSADGRYQVYTAVGPSAHPYLQVFVHDHVRNASREVSVTPDGEFGQGNSFSPAISADGLHIVFESLAEDLMAAGDSNGVEDIYLVVNPLEVILNSGFEE